MNPDIEIAIDSFRRLSAKYSRPERYYRGEHDLSFATEKFQNAFGSLFREFAMNLCPAIVDAVKDKLRINGFRVDVPAAVAAAGAGGSNHEKHEIHEKGKQAANALDSVSSVARSIWNRNRMGQRAGELHKEALRCGDAYAVVWFDPRGEVTIYPQAARSVTVQYDEDSPGRMKWAAKHWRSNDKHIRLNIYYADRIERYFSPKSNVQSGGVQSPMSNGQSSADLSALDFRPWTLEGNR